MQKKDGIFTCREDFSFCWLHRSYGCVDDEVTAFVLLCKTHSNYLHGKRSFLGAGLMAMCVLGCAHQQTGVAAQLFDATSRLLQTDQLMDKSSVQDILKTKLTLTQSMQEGQRMCSQGAPFIAEDSGAFINSKDVMNISFSERHTSEAPRVMYRFQTTLFCSSTAPVHRYSFAELTFSGLNKADCIRPSILRARFPHGSMKRPVDGDPYFSIDVAPGPTEHTNAVFMFEAGCVDFESIQIRIKAR